MADTQLLRDVAQVRRLAFELERGVARDDFQRGYLRQSGGDVLADPVAEIFLFDIAAHVREGQDADRNRAPTRSPRSIRLPHLASESRDAHVELLPAGTVFASVPAAEVGALNLVEGQGRHRPVNRGLDQSTRVSRRVGLRAN